MPPATSWTPEKEVHLLMTVLEIQGIAVTKATWEEVGKRLGVTMEAARQHFGMMRRRQQTEAWAHVQQQLEERQVSSSNDKPAATTSASET